MINPSPLSTEDREAVQAPTEVPNAKINPYSQFTFPLMAKVVMTTFAISGNVNWLYGLILALGTSVGAWTASRSSVDRGEGFIKLVMILMVVFMALKLWLSQ